jgi:hypothetical protein
MLEADRVGLRRRSSALIIQVIAETLLGAVAIAAPFNRYLAHYLVLSAILVKSRAPWALWWHARPIIGRLTCGWPLGLRMEALEGRQVGTGMGYCRNLRVDRAFSSLLHKKTEERQVGISTRGELAWRPLLRGGLSWWTRSPNVPPIILP